MMLRRIEENFQSEDGAVNAVFTERRAIDRLREDAEAAEDARVRMECDLLARMIETGSAFDQVGEVIDEAGDAWRYAIALKAYAAEVGGHGLPSIMLERARGGADRFIAYCERVNKALVLSEDEKKLCTERVVEAVLSGV